MTRLPPKTSAARRRGLVIRPALAFVMILCVTACSGASPSTPAVADTETAPADSLAPVGSPAADARVEPSTAASVAVREEPSAAALGVAPTTTSLAEPRPAPELAGLVNPDGTPFDLAEYRGTNTLLFFGYTHCPDVCPQTIGEIFGVFKELPETRAVFVSVDPERDTPEFLAEWTAYLPDHFDAVTGSPGAIRRAADDYGVKYARVETTSTAGYTMSHTANVYLIDADGQLRTIYPFGTPAADIVADLNQLTAG